MNGYRTISTSIPLHGKFIIEERLVQNGIMIEYVKLYRDKHTSEYISKDEMKKRRQNLIFDKLTGKYFTKREFKI